MSIEKVGDNFLLAVDRELESLLILPEKLKLEPFVQGFELSLSLSRCWPFAFELSKQRRVADLKKYVKIFVPNEKFQCFSRDVGAIKQTIDSNFSGPF
jgi:hypothetical protein